MEDGQLIDQLWTRFTRASTQDGYNLARSLSEYETGPGPETYIALVRALSLAVTSLRDEPAVKARVMKLAQDLLGIGELEGISCHGSEEALELYRAWQDLAYYSQCDEDLAEDYWEARARAGVLLADQMQVRAPAE